MKQTWVVAAALALAACTGDQGQQQEAPPAQPQIKDAVTVETFADSLNVDLTQMRRTEDGLYIQELKEGTGDTVAVGQKVKMGYIGWLPSGFRFDSSEGKGKKPYEFTVGRGEVIKGWDQGVVGMKVGGQRRIVVPPRLGYGDEGAAGVIPPSSVLVFNLELLSVEK